MEKFICPKCGNEPDYIEVHEVYIEDTYAFDYDGYGVFSSCNNFDETIRCCNVCGYDVTDALIEYAKNNKED